MIGFHAALGSAQEQGGVFFVGLGLVACFFADTRQGLVDLIHGDRAMVDIDEVAALSCEQESDIADLAVAWALEVGRDLGAVAPLFGRGDGSGDDGVDSGHVL